MIKAVIVVCSISVLFLTGCAALNWVGVHYHYNSTYSTGRALLELQEAHEKRAISGEEYTKMRAKIIKSVVDEKK